MNYKELDQLIKKVEEYNDQEAYYTYRDDSHYICDNDGSTMHLNGKEMVSDSLDKLLELGTKTYKAGQLFKLNDATFVLAQVDTFLFCLIHIEAGNRMKNPVIVEDIENITEKELRKIYQRAAELRAINSLKDA